MLVEINNDNPVWREPVKDRSFWAVLDTDGNEPENYPVDVINVNGDVIGSANHKDEYIQMWNADSENAAQGILLGERSPFVFVFAGKRIQPSNVLALDLESAEDFITESNEILNQE